MEQYEIDTINKAFDNCFGLKDAFIKYSDSEDKMMRETITSCLAGQTGLRIDFINNNRKEIKEL